ncbi:hypothetical protein MPTK1_1g16910 [Marchantia polymorpha subsp. ruderalis]|uniref:Protein kinase domain-containing protein n=2 Tax=Marchantia polymorpha TaxID=3197 RepID=A0AAF6AR08_MARPO|nr:hypothetical protein MARPO_0001s0031 [Marchantia polymorpha]BBM98878.1 hypothetical protein Mp_1g16910 [Marchantia polymorpha subsp. ruderalis]|eukprot:PTQ49954.1 hypothetical protein MARPO_0001s0031 [Marchantia polymorpha]
MEALSLSSAVRGTCTPLPSLIRGHCTSNSRPSIKVPKLCTFGTRSRKNGVAASAIASGAEFVDFAQLQVELAHSLAALDLPLAADAGESSIWWTAAAAPLAWWYLSAAPGSLGGLMDYASTPLHSHSHMSYNPAEVEVGKQIGQGSFGIVYEGYIGRGKRRGSQNKETHVILKKAKPNIRGASQMHDAEVYMNHRVQRTAPNACAEFLGTTSVSSSQTHGRLTEGLWLIWKFEGGRTLDYYLKQKNFPNNVSDYILGSQKPRKQISLKEQNKAVIRKIMFQILTNLRNLHRTGLVHRDVKPLNLILAEDEGTFKLIDLGACVDLRSGYNYVPDETIIDPTYAAPEHHIMPISTPELPPDPLCSLISPLVWALNTPDRFDLYSAGLIMLQMAFQPLRQDINLSTFNRELKRAGYNLDEWRRKCRYDEEDFDLLDADGGAGWELVKAMLQPRHDKMHAIWPSLGSSRPSAEAALKHRFFTGSFIKLPSFEALPIIPSLENLKIKEARRSSKSVVVSSMKSKGAPKFETQPDLEINFTEILPALTGLTQPALAVGACWLIFSGLRSSAQATYAVGQWATQSLGISGTAFVAVFLIIKPWLEARNAKPRKDDVPESESNVPAALDQKSHVELGTDDGQLTTMPYVSRTHVTGLSEAVKNMELQLASLEASISVEREFAHQQQKRILEIEKLLIRTQPAAATKSNSRTQ